MKNGKKCIIILSSVLLAGLLTAILFFVILPERSYEDIRQMSIQNVNLDQLEDGVYQGEFAYGQYTYHAEVTVKNHRIEEIKLSHGNKSKQAKAAEGVIDTILTEQKVDVDVVSGATTTSKAILKAVENALSQNK